MTYKRKLLLIALLTASSLGSLAQNTDRLDFVVRHTTMKHAMRNASFAVCVHNITTDSTIYSRDDDRAMMPAAINKLFTTAAA